MDFFQLLDSAYSMYNAGNQLSKMFSPVCYSCKEKKGGDYVRIAYHPKYLKIHPDNYIERQFCSLLCFIKNMRYKHYYIISEDDESNPVVKMINNFRPKKK